MAEKCLACGEMKDDVESRPRNYKIYRICKDCADTDSAG
jgi:hypothetical protein